MSNVDVKPVSSATGTFRTLSQSPDNTVRGGNAAPEAGKVAPESAPKSFDPEKLAAKLNAISRSIGRDLRFKVDVESGNSVIQVLDRDTGEIIREIPPEKAELSLSVNGDVNLRLYDSRI